MFHIADSFGGLAASTVGATHVFVAMFDPLQVLKTIQEERVSYSLLVPTMINLIVNHPDLPEYDLSSLTNLPYGGSAIPEAVLLKAFEVLPDVEYMQAYGQTEAGPILTLLSNKYHTISSENAGKLKAAGKAVPGVDLAILNEQDEVLPMGEVGEICARGENIMLGYWNMPEMTAETLRSGWLHTGDGGRLDEDGMLWVVDRIKDMIVSGGENVFSAETEQAIYSHPAVAECAVIGIPHETWGEQVHAIVRLHEPESLSEQQLQDHCRSLIATFKCPKSIEFRDQPLPVSGAGKILKKDLRAPFWEGKDRNVG